ncbi:MAG: ribonuclease P protein component [Bacteroidota bacterium]
MKPDILRGRNAFATVLSEGRAITSGQLRCFYLVLKQQGSGVKTGFAVTRDIKSAVARNRSKRLMRQAWRAHRKGIRQKATSTKAEIRIVFFSKDTGKNGSLQYKQFDDSMKKLLEKLNEQLSR